MKVQTLIFTYFFPLQIKHKRNNFEGHFYCFSLQWNSGSLQGTKEEWYLISRSKEGKGIPVCFYGSLLRGKKAFRFLHEYWQVVVNDFAAGEHGYKLGCSGSNSCLPSQTLPAFFSACSPPSVTCSHKYNPEWYIWACSLIWEQEAGWVTEAPAALYFTEIKKTTATVSWMSCGS